jgi:2-amino-4-hydroxy-6-hydroxymethyldihydropteridine diphosphokinase
MTDNKPHRVHIGLGANVGDRTGTIEQALVEIGRLPGTRVAKASSIRETPPMGGPPQPDYLNGAALVETELEPIELLTEVKSIERSLGRRPGERWGPRSIDIDLLTFDDRVIDTEELTVPHPRMTQRRFVLEPLAEIDPDGRHPTEGKTFAELLKELD